jgi:hypothetical protein
MPDLLRTFLILFVGIIVHWREENELAIGKLHVKGEKRN